MYVIDPLFRKEPYETPYLPPYSGDRHQPVPPGPDGHFDHLDPGTREFLAAHAFACVRRVLDISESYLGRQIPWFFQPTYERLEIVPRLPWANAQCGYGFLELGEDDTQEEPFPYALNFDVIAHETGHLVLFGALGIPERSTPSIEFLGYHEFAADFVSLIGLMHFDSALDRVLRRTKGNLLLANELDRLAELSDERQIRVGNHSLKLSDVGSDLHDLSKPFVGAMFDSLIEIYHLLLVERGLLDLDTRDIRTVREDLSSSQIDRAFDVGAVNYGTNHFTMKSVLQEARDIVAEATFRSWMDLDPDTISFRAAAAAIVRACEDGRGSRFADRVHDNFVWRELL
jgi:hypothetical protein